MSTKKKIVKKLNEYGNEKKHVVMNSDKYKEIGDELDDDTVVKIVDEDDAAGRGIEHGINPEADEDEYEERKKLSQGNPNVSEDDTVEPVNVPKLKSDVQKFMDQLDLNRFKNILSKIDKPIEKAELIAVFAERIGVPRAKLPVILSALKTIGDNEQQASPVENTRPRMKKSDLVEHVLKNKR
jgi:hypothetical protein